MNDLHYPMITKDLSNFHLKLLVHLFEQLAKACLGSANAYVTSNGVNKSIGSGMICG